VTGRRRALSAARALRRAGDSLTSPTTDRAGPDPARRPASPPRGRAQPDPAHRRALSRIDPPARCGSTSPSTGAGRVWCARTRRAVGQDPKAIALSQFLFVTLGPDRATGRLDHSDDGLPDAARRVVAGSWWALPPAATRSRAGGGLEVSYSSVAFRRRHVAPPARRRRATITPAPLTGVASGCSLAPWRTRTRRSPSSSDPEAMCRRRQNGGAVRRRSGHPLRMRWEIV
jgi:hypothetical protein